jgi:hypothetical protein
MNIIVKNIFMKTSERCRERKFQSRALVAYPALFWGAPISSSLAPPPAQDSD